MPINDRNEVRLRQPVRIGAGSRGGIHAARPERLGCSRLWRSDPSGNGLGKLRFNQEVPRRVWVDSVRSARHCPRSNFLAGEWSLPDPLLI